MAAPEYAVLDAWYKWLITNVKIESDLISINKVKNKIIIADIIFIFVF